MNVALTADKSCILRICSAMLKNWFQLPRDTIIFEYKSKTAKKNFIIFLKKKLKSKIVIEKETDLKTSQTETLITS